MTKTHTRAPLALLAALIACNGKPAPAPPPRVTIEIFTDDSARTIAIERATPLAELVGPAPGRWLEVRADTRDGRFLELEKPSLTYQGDEIRLYAEDGRAAIGVFPPVTADMPAEVARRASQPIVSLTPIASVHVMTHAVELPALTVVVGGKDIRLASAALRALATTGERHAQGWALVDVIALSGAQPTGPVRIIGAQEVTLAPAELAKAVVKPNQRGEYVVRVWDEGAKSPTREVRGVTKILVGGS